MTDHNPYVGIQRTVFEQGWQRALKELEKRVKDDSKLDTSVFSDSYSLESILYMIDEVRSA